MSDALFPLTAKYDLDWTMQNSVGENVLYDLESLCEIIDIQEDKRILDLGCGNAISSIFLAKEFNAHVWAIDKWASPADNYQRAIESGAGDRVHPLKADARNLPFPKEFFDIAISINSYHLFGMDASYLPYLAQFIKRGGFVGIVDTCPTKEFGSPSVAPQHLKPTETNNRGHVHPIKWWRDLWEETGLISVLRAEALPYSDFILQNFIDDMDDNKDSGAERPTAATSLANAEGFVTLFSMVGQRTDKKIDSEPF